MNLKDFEYRRETINAKELFPKFDLKKLMSLRGMSKANDVAISNPHQVIFDLSLELWDGGYDFILDEFGFHDQNYSKFDGHCHQITPALGVVLKALGFKHVAYLECMRVDEETLKQIPPEEEQSEMKDEFCAIGRIPYCCLEVEIADEMFYLTGKHLKKVDGQPEALLSPICYRDMVGVFAHQDDSSKSGIYLQTVKGEPFVWKKQTVRDAQPETFKTFCHMTLELGE